MRATTRLNHRSAKHILTPPAPPPASQVRAAAGSTSPNTSSTNGPRYEPAVLPVATEATVEHELKRLGNTELLNWNLEVAGPSLDGSSLLTSRLPPSHPFSRVAGLAAAHGDAVRDADERRGVATRARVSAVGPRLPAAGIDAALGVGDRRVYFLSHSQRLQIITMTKERKSTMRGGAARPRTRSTSSVIDDCARRPTCESSSMRIWSGAGTDLEFLRQQVHLTNSVKAVAYPWNVRQIVSAIALVARGSTVGPGRDPQVLPPAPRSLT